eukprot:TRINITY_DN281_c0_g2_i1.p1 TRINITY_DN281_c0_g2~~TRINITY_DN281_c0_g2_i1.p1  ORF type:complete len:191 (+),score=49.84 TRINITY_DN281_c0_g2_i1:156-728(+)
MTRRSSRNKKTSTPVVGRASTYGGFNNLQVTQLAKEHTAKQVRNDADRFRKRPAKKGDTTVADVKNEIAKEEKKPRLLRSQAVKTICSPFQSKKRSTYTGADAKQAATAATPTRNASGVSSLETDALIGDLTVVFLLDVRRYEGTLECKSSSKKKRKAITKEVICQGQRHAKRLRQGNIARSGSKKDDDL